MATASPASTVSYGILLHDYDDLKFGTLGVIEDDTNSSCFKFILIYEEPSKEVQCPKKYLEVLDYETFMMLLEVGRKKEYWKRLELFVDKQRLESIKQLSLQDDVTVKGIDNELQRGKLQYRGVTKKSMGYMYGILLNKEFRGKGTSDGLFQGVQYFKCEEDCARFVAASLINPPTNSRQAMEHASQTSADSRHLLSTSESIQLGDESDKLKVGERVVWLSDECKPHSGTVKWVGVLEEEREMGLIVGVEFDDSIGKGTGKFRGRDLFTAKRGHASLVPAIGLVRHSEYFAGHSERSDGGEQQTAPNVMQGRSSEGSRGVGDRVQVLLVKGTVFGIIRYIGGIKLGNMLQERQVFGLEMEVADDNWTDGTHGKTRYFTCKNKHALFVPVEICQLAPSVATQTEQQVTDVAEQLATTRLKTFTN